MMRFFIIPLLLLIACTASKLIECFCDQRKLLSTYNQAAASVNRSSREPLALWSDSLIAQLGRKAK